MTENAESDGVDPVTTLTAAQMVAAIEAVQAASPVVQRPDTRSTEQIEFDAAHEHAAELARSYAECPTDVEAEFLARRRAS